MAVTVSYFNKFLESVGRGEINLAMDTFRLILVDGYTFDGTDEELTDIGAVEIADGNGYTTGGTNLTGVSFVFTVDRSRWDANDVAFLAAGGSIGPTSGAIIFDETAGDKLVCYMNFGQDESAGDETEFKITFNADGIFSITT